MVNDYFAEFVNKKIQIVLRFLTSTLYPVGPCICIELFYQVLDVQLKCHRAIFNAREIVFCTSKIAQ